ncbi:hypothetical protein Z052_01885 [Halorubrum sp. C191]|uniref:NADPH-dependent 7-cyano-7-deazaguanine reductase QueF n=1 Tax=Halorubrum sp. C191 TaxID=1383842 RepID=UPI000C07C677|nr:NADPH-dependent 7-cyano-7-deazaguanine reductase QueF [Halorubrum sp. C191]PHQ43913.1 hypothetical protein Z052_01885 [Halorubrum sp. C191]
MYEHEVKNERGALLEEIAAPSIDAGRVVSFDTEELTAFCPFDFGGPDFYRLVIRYIPGESGIESKSLKQYVESWREAEISAENLGAEIYRDITETADLVDCYVRLEQARRGGIEETVEFGAIDREILRSGARGESSAN